MSDPSPPSFPEHKLEAELHQLSPCFQSDELHVMANDLVSFFKLLIQTDKKLEKESNNDKQQ